MKDRLNLLPQEFQDAVSAGKRIKLWAVVLCVVGAACAGILYQQRQSLASLKQEQAANTSRVTPLRKKLAESASARQQLSELRTKHTLVSMLEDELPAVQILGVVSRSAQDPDRRILVTKLNTDEIMRDIPNAAAAPVNPRTRRPANVKQEKVLAVVVSGVARDDIAVTRFVTKLRQSKMFRSVKLNSTSGGEQAANIGRKYEVECVY